MLAEDTTNALPLTIRYFNDSHSGKLIFIAAYTPVILILFEAVII